ncbi:NaCP60E [Symbiodinium necroappetens]|uniref:NaCP60E protein n=1 Tax=Symbiodinium necroappetens TaxID=1628268 RepID=A0A812SNA4_9DINO|nr:NaCP60E [Symbiodinium necroappetens]
MQEDKSKEKFTEMPLCLIIEKYKNAPGGKQFVQDILKSQTGRKHPQSEDKNMRIYKVFDCIANSSALVHLQSL